MKELQKNTVENSELVEQTFNFWFNDNKHIRSPFPYYIQSELKVKATDKFHQWVNNLNSKAKEELNDEMIGERFEEIIFDTATSLIKTEDERITIIYPFLPRLGDKIQGENQEDSFIKDRSILKEGDTSFLNLKLEKTESKEKWETKIELPL